MTARFRYTATRIAIVGVVLLATLTNLEFTWDTAAAALRLGRALRPELHWGDAIDGLRNLALFAGLGAVWIVTSFAARVRRDIAQSTALGCALSLTVEGLQLFSPVRNASVVDVFTNTLGAFLGSTAIAVLLVTLRREKEVKSYVGLSSLFIAGPYLMALLCEALTPLFRSEPILELRGSPLERWRGSLALATPLAFRAIPFSDIPLFAAGGFALVMLLREHTLESTRATRLALIAGVLLIVGTHLLHGAFGLEIHWEAIATDVVSLALGCWVALRWLAPLTQQLRGVRGARAMLGAYAALLLLWGWRPLQLELTSAEFLGQLHWDRFIPLSSLAGRVDVFSAVHVAQQFLLYVPLGALLAIWPLRLRGRWSYLWPAFLFAMLVEAGHFIVAERLFDFTNALLAMAGLEIGWVLVRRCGYSPYGEILNSDTGAARVPPAR